MGDKAGTDVEKIQADWADEFVDLDMATDWEMIDDGFQRQSRWCTHWVKILRHDSGKTIGIEYAKDVGDGESADTYPVEWFEVESYEVTQTKWRRIDKNSQGDPS